MPRKQGYKPKMAGVCRELCQLFPKRPADERSFLSYTSKSYPEISVLVEFAVANEIAGWRTGMDSD